MSESGGPTQTAWSLVSRARLRVLVALALFALGLCLGRGLSVGAWVWLSVALGLCAAGALSRGWCWRVVMGLAVVCAGAGWMQARVFEQSRNGLGALLHLQGQGRALVTVEGTVLGTPRTIVPPQGPLAFGFLSEARTRLDVVVDTLVEAEGSRGACGKLWVRVGQRRGLVTARAGDRVRLTGWLEAVDAPLNPGEEDLRSYAAQEGFAGSLALSGPELLAPAATHAGLFVRARSEWLGWRASLEDRARDILTRAAGREGPGRALLLGLVLGDYDPASREVRDAFARQGLAHVLSISGFHLSVMALLTLSVLRFSGDRGWVEPVVVACAVLLYVCIVPASSPIVRSAAMVLAIMAAEASGRRYDRLTLLAWIAMGLLVWRPLDLWNVGFQLSLGLTSALFWLGPVFHARLWGVRIEGLVRREVRVAEVAVDWLKQGVSTALMCWLLAAPLVMCRFGIISPLAIAATVLVTPLIVVVLWIGYGSLLVGLVVPGAADAAGFVLQRLTGWAARSVQLFDSVAWSALRVPVVSGWWAGAATLVVIYWCRWGHRRDWRAWSASAVVAGWLAWQCVFSGGLHRGTALRIDTFAVGNGTCHLLRSGNEGALWDCGPMAGVGAGGAPPLVRAVRELGAWQTPTVFITHPDLDHFGGLLDVVEPLGVQRVVTCPRFLKQAAEQPDGPAAFMARELARRGVEVRAAHAGAVFSIGDATLTLLSPPQDAAWPLDNDHSLVGLWAVAGHAQAMLLTGDVQDDAIAALARANPALHPTVLELPHHGSARAEALRWTLGLEPPVVLQSTGPLRANDPRWDGLRAGRGWYTTCVDGAAWVEFGRAGDVRSGSVRGGAALVPTDGERGR